MNQKVRSILFSGGPHSGKSTIVKAFKNLGYPVSEEAAIQVINDLNNSIGIQEQIKFRDNNIDEFQELVYQKQIRYEAEAKKLAKKDNLNYIICDRGIYDGLTYYKLFNKKPDLDFFDKISKHRYDYVFVCEVLKDFDDRADTGRFENYETAQQLSQYTLEAYKPYADHILWLPDIGLENRIKLVFDAVLGRKFRYSMLTY